MASIYDALGNVGQTDHVSMPRINNIFGTPDGVNAGLVPQNLYFYLNSANPLLSPGLGISNVNTMKSNGLVPCIGGQSWGDLYPETLPLVSDEPSWLTAKRTSYSSDTLPDWQGWSHFITNNLDYVFKTYDGNYIGSGSGYGTGRFTGYISPQMPIRQADLPPGMTSGVYADLFGYQYGRACGQTGTFGIALSDFVDSNPLGSAVGDFNPRIITAFAGYINSLYPGYFPNNVVPGATLTNQAQYIIQNLYNEWTDYMCIGMAKLFASLAKHIKDFSGTDALVVDQCGYTMVERRGVGIDHKITKQYCANKNVIYFWDIITYGGDRGGNPPIVNKVLSPVIAAAYQPESRNGFNMEVQGAVHDGLAVCFPTLTDADWTEGEPKFLRRMWTYVSWSHIIDQNLATRRACVFCSHSYWDAGSITTIAPLDTLINTITPTKPFGMAIYFSENAMRKMETEDYAFMTVGNSAYVAYFAREGINAIMDSGLPVNYFFSSTVLFDLNPGNISLPSAIYVYDPNNHITGKERRKLTSLGIPVVYNVTDAKALTNQPLYFPTGMSGFAFWDQNNRLILCVNNPDQSVTSASVTGTITLPGLPAGTYTATEISNSGNPTYPVTTVNGHPALANLTVTRWDARIFAIQAS